MGRRTVGKRKGIDGRHRENAQENAFAGTVLVRFVCRHHGQVGGCQRTSGNQVAQYVASAAAQRAEQEDR